MTDREIMRQALGAIKAAHRSHIEFDYRPNQNYMLEIIGKLEAALAQPEQEPVRWFQQFGDAPPKREWVGLTDDEIDTHAQQNSFTPHKAPSWFVEVCRDIEAKLKELNT